MYLVLWTNEKRIVSIGECLISGWRGTLGYVHENELQFLLRMLSKSKSTYFNNLITVYIEPPNKIGDWFFDNPMLNEWGFTLGFLKIERCDLTNVLQG